MNYIIFAFLLLSLVFSTFKEINNNKPDFQNTIDPNKRYHLWVHTPKTAGSSLKYLLTQYTTNNDQYTFYPCYRENEQVSIDYEKVCTEIHHIKSNTVIIYGHYFYGIHKLCNITNYQYFTVLREPAERLLSLYHFIKKNREHHAHHLVNNSPFIEFISIDDYQNQMIRRLTDFDIAHFNDCNYLYNKLILQNNTHIYTFDKWEQLINELNYVYPSIDRIPISVRNKNNYNHTIEDITLSLLKQQNTCDYFLYNKIKER